MTLIREDAPAPLKAPLPKDHTAQLQAVRTALAAFKGPVAPDDLAQCFLKARTARVMTLLDDLVKLGLARRKGRSFLCDAGTSVHKEDHLCLVQVKLLAAAVSAVVSSSNASIAAALGATAARKESAAINSSITGMPEMWQSRAKGKHV
jgi:hypothetical protein